MDVNARLTEGEISDTINFCCRAFIPIDSEKKEAVLRKMDSLGLNDETLDAKTKGELEASMSPEEVHIMHQIRARQMIRTEDTVNIDTFSFDTIEGLTVNLQRGSLGLIRPCGDKKMEQLDAVGLWHGEGNMDNIDETPAPSEQGMTEEVPTHA